MTKMKMVGMQQLLNRRSKSEAAVVADEGVEVKERAVELDEVR